MNIVPADSVAPHAIADCLAHVARHDLMVLPAPVAEVLADYARVAVSGDTVIGVGWRRNTVDGTTIDVRVRPGSRRKGVGTALLDHLSQVSGPLTVSCDAGHQRAGQFVEHRGFEPVGFVFHQRWDGAPDDAPRAFKTAELRVEDDAHAALDLLHEASADGWPRPNLMAHDLSPDRIWLRSAFVDGKRVGAIAACIQEDAFAIGAFAVLPAYRNRGIGRSLLCELMKFAANQGQGVVLRVSHADERLRGWTAALGFWTYRTWAHYRRGDSEPQHAEG